MCRVLISKLVTNESEGLAGPETGRSPDIRDMRRESDQLTKVGYWFQAFFEVFRGLRSKEFRWLTPINIKF